MENELAVYDDNVPAIADDSLLRVAQQAEQRIDAVIKIKKMALKVTNPRDWTDQGGNPYLQVSGAEKIANLFNISWRIDEPICETEDDGHFTFTYVGTFTIPGRSIQVTGSRSSKDPFFKKYDWNNGVKTEKPISAIDRRDVKMAAMTNLLGNGITRLLGIRNLTYNDLKEFANIDQSQLGKVEFKGKNGDKAPVAAPQKKTAQGAQAATITIKEVAEQTKTKDDKPMKNPKYHVWSDDGINYQTFDKKLVDIAKGAIGLQANVTFETNQYGNDLKTIEIAERDPGAEG